MNYSNKLKKSWYSYCYVQELICSKLKLMRNPEINDYEGNTSRGDKNIEGRYANYFKVGHNAFEFVIDFGQHYAESEEAELYIRIITSPCYAKELLHTLKKSIERFEKTFGDIKEK